MTYSNSSSYDITLQQLTSHLNLLKSIKLETITFSDLKKSSFNPHKKIILTFDDGYKSDVTMAMPVLIKYGLRAVFFPTVNNIGKMKYISWEDLKELYANDMEIGSHGLTHRYLGNLTDHEIIQELTGSKEKIEDTIHNSIECISFPGGSFNERIIKMAEQIGYKYLCTSKPGMNALSSSSNILNRICLRNSTTDDQVVKLLSQDIFYIKKAYCRYLILNQIKLILGNKLFDQIRHNLYEKTQLS